MPHCQIGDASIHYNDTGPSERAERLPLLLIAPGGMRSAIGFWDNTPWNPITELGAGRRVVAMDQRNAGASTAPVSADDGWHSYTADQLGLLDQLGIDRFHVAGMCIGGPYVMALIQAAPERVASATLMQTIGLADNRQAFYDMFDSWADKLAPGSGVAAGDWQSFRGNMYDSDDFLFVVGDDFVRRCATPLLVLEGDDLYHPRQSSERIRDLAPQVTYLRDWKEGDGRAAAMIAFAEFLGRHDT